METPFVNYLVLFLSLALGLALGSFYNVCIHRYIAGESIVTPPSHCPACGKRLTARELIPLLSYLIQRGRCLGCQARISPRYPLVEALSGLWSLAAFLQYGPSLAWIACLVFGGIFIVASFIDFELFILPDILTIPGSLLALAAGPWIFRLSYTQSWGGALAGGLGFYLLHLFYRLIRKREGLGLGDVKLMVLIGALVGLSNLPLTLILGSVSALLASLFYMRGAKTKYSQVPIPFGPFLSFGAMVQILYGHQVMGWYLTRVLG